MRPYKFNFIDDSSTILDGFFAHEVTTVPEAISGTKDAVATAADVSAGISTYVGEPIYQTIDQSKLVPLLVAAVQELITKVETLEGLKKGREAMRMSLNISPKAKSSEAVLKFWATGKMLTKAWKANKKKRKK